MKLIPISNSKNLPLKSWANEDKPREKLLQKGRNALSNAELLAIILGSGTKQETVLDLSKRILNSVNNDLHALSKLGVHELMKFKGIGQAKAISIAATVELANRKRNFERKDKDWILNSHDAYHTMFPFLADLDHEEFWILLLNTRKRLLDRKLISVGGLDKTIVDHRIIFKKAIESNATAIILCHNHPSGEPEPSKADILLTNRLIDSGHLLGISVIDHIIIAGNTYLSFAEEDLMKEAA